MNELIEKLNEAEFKDTFKTISTAGMKKRIAAADEEDLVEMLYDYLAQLSADDLMYVYDDVVPGQDIKSHLVERIEETLGSEDRIKGFLIGLIDAGRWKTIG